MKFPLHSRRRVSTPPPHALPKCGDSEFAVADWNAKAIAQNIHKPENVLRFMETLLPQLEKLDFVERYAWFPAESNKPTLGTSCLFDETGKLARLGECYRDA